MSQTNLSIYNNDWYKKDIGASKLKQMCWYFTNVLFFINPCNPFGGLKIWLLKIFGAQIGKGVIIKPAVNIKYPWKLIIGDYSWIGERTWIDNLDNVSIGKHVCISQGAMLLTGNHNYKKASFDLIVKPIELHDGAWVGARALVAPGVIVETHAVLSALSVATTNLLAFTVYQGNPAVAIRKRIIK